MSPSSVRLPGFAEVASLADSATPQHTANYSSNPQCHSGTPAPGETPVSCSTPLADPPLPQRFEPPSSGSNRSSWTAINRPVQFSSSATSPPRQLGEHSKQQQTTNAFNDLSTLRSNHQAPSHHGSRHSPPREPQRKLASKERPIRGPRQDSAVSESQSSLASLPVHELPTSPGVIPSCVSSSSDMHQPSVGCNAVHPKTPPSPAPSPIPGPISSQSQPASSPLQSTRHDRDQGVHPEPRNQEFERDHLTHPVSVYSDSTTLFDSQSSSAIAPHRTESNSRSAEGSMPPPPHPLPGIAAPTSNLQSYNDESCPPSAMPSSAQHNSTVEAGVSDGRQYPSYFPAVPHHSGNQPHAASLTDVVPSVDLGNPSQTRCLYCNDLWKFPQPDTKWFYKPSKTIDELGSGTDSILNTLQQFAARRDNSYIEWLSFHQVDPQDSPCRLQNSTSDASSASSKRRSDVPGEAGQMSSKLRRLSCNTPSPKISQLTPPPEPTSTSPSHHTTIPERLHPVGAGKVYVTDGVATILGFPNAPPPTFERPANDASNMWFEPSRERRHAASEHPSNGTSAPRTENEAPGVEVDGKNLPDA